MGWVSEREREKKKGGKVTKQTNEDTHEEKEERRAKD